VQRGADGARAGRFRAAQVVNAGLGHQSDVIAAEHFALVARDLFRLVGAPSPHTLFIPETQKNASTFSHPIIEVLVT